MPSAIIVDDEPLLRRDLRETLGDLWPELSVLGECADGAAAHGGGVKLKRVAYSDPTIGPGWRHYCPGCKWMHVIPTDRRAQPNGHAWTFNGDTERHVIDLGSTKLAELKY